MGLYVFYIIDNPNIIKIGYTHNSDPYMRILKNGFNDILHPLNINVDYNNLKLMYWLQTLDIQIEKYFHRIFRKYRIIGEFYNYEKIKNDKFFIDNIIGVSKIKSISAVKPSGITM